MPYFFTPLQMAGLGTPLCALLSFGTEMGTSESPGELLHTQIAGPQPGVSDSARLGVTWTCTSSSQAKLMVLTL